MGLWYMGTYMGIGECHKYHIPYPTGISRDGDTPDTRNLKLKLQKNKTGNNGFKISRNLIQGKLTRFDYTYTPPANLKVQVAVNSSV